MFSLAGKTALVTGANSGIGLAIATGLAQAGARVAICGRHAEANEAALVTLAAIRPDAAAFVADLRDAEMIPELFHQVHRELGGVDLLVNNVGAVSRARADEVHLDEDFAALMQLNVTAGFALAQCFARARLARQQPGAMLFTSSILSERARPGLAAYAISKGAVQQMVRALAVDFAPHGIRVNGLGPGYMRTDMTAGLQADPAFDAMVKERTPLGRWGVPADLAGAAVFLCSDAAAFITGQTLYVDGGWLAAI